jgi:hypothetical protein
LIHEDKFIKVEADEMSTCFSIDVCFKSDGQFPAGVLTLFNSESLEADKLAEIGYNTLYAAFLYMDEKDIKSMKERVNNI